ncbi:type VI secretion system-associated FHA domain protein TagH [Enterobacterales bacterium CwR94]|nr:type VI secretion system-associated FHA domain protein TagH [Enterobacterales bacterium CwR94]
MRFTLLNPPPDTDLTFVDFQPPGGTIGRSLENDMVLPDEERTISRLQALVHLTASGECRLTNHSSVTLVELNGVALARGHQVDLQHGDSLVIGPYQIGVSDPARENAPGEDAPEQQDDPWDLFAPPDAPEVEQPLEPARSAHHHEPRLRIDPVSGHERADASEAAPLDETRLIRALMEGMGLDLHANSAALTEEQMRMTGRMLSLFSQGTVALLSSRSILKRGVKAEMTMILNEANNPFKILPSGKTVLMQMYQSQMPGFMAPEHAVRDGLVDLQAHQLGMIAGIRAIIAAMLQTFNPQRLEEMAQRDGVAPRFALPNGKKAALWDYFNRHYQHTAGEIEDDFHTLFGEAFLHAYDLEVNQYKDSQSKADEP